MTNTTRETANGTPYRWEDNAGIIHAAEGADVTPGSARTFLMWTVCGGNDIPANRAWANFEKVTCPKCRATLSN